MSSPPAHIVEAPASLVTEELMTQPDSLEIPPVNQTAQVEKKSSKSLLAAEVTKIINKPPLQACNLLLRAYTNVTDDHGWAMIGSMSSYIHANHSDFDPRTFGCAKFIDLIQKTDAFELVQRAHKNGQSYFCRPKRSGREHAGTSEYLTALLKAVAEAKAPNGWAPISMIGQKLRALGHDISGSGFSTLTEALKATSLFEMQGSGAARYFRAKT
ncbi:MAG: OST-HTH/LOTUS domain-containing protein [Candidatus Accumulibacter sp.]|nr:OST-HTH/LOTUS domain-containing protein [Accumulibacter sp.]